MSWEEAAQVCQAEVRQERWRTSDGRFGGRGSRGEWGGKWPSSKNLWDSLRGSHHLTFLTAFSGWCFLCQKKEEGIFEMVTE